MLGPLVVGVVLVNVFALLLVLVRAPLYGTRVYRPMLLNIGLSVAPVVVLLVTFAVDLVAVQVFGSRSALALVTVAGGVVWLLLLPNAGYLITELNFSHRKEGEHVPLWYDIVAVLTLTMSGVLNTVVNVFLAQSIFVLVAYPNDDRPFARPSSWVFVAVVLVLVSFGIYLGRNVRFNSWDLLHPRSFARKLLGHLRTPGVPGTVALYCLLHTVFFALMYTVVVGPVVVWIDRQG